MVITDILATQVAASSGSEVSKTLASNTRRVILRSSTANVQVRFSSGGTGAVIPTDNKYVLEHPALGGATLYFFHATSGTAYILEQKGLMS